MGAIRWSIGACLLSFCPSRQMVASLLVVGGIEEREKEAGWVGQHPDFMANRNNSPCYLWVPVGLTLRRVLKAAGGLRRVLVLHPQTSTKPI